MINWSLLVVQGNHSFCAGFLFCFMNLKLQLAALARSPHQSLRPCVTSFLWSLRGIIDGKTFWGTFKDWYYLSYLV